MARPIPDPIANPEMSQVRLDKFSSEYISGNFEYAVVNHGSTITGKPKHGDTFSWRAGGDLCDYSITCEGDVEVVGGWVELYRWYLKKRSVDAENAETIYYLDTPAEQLHVVEDDKLCPANAREINDFVTATIDLLWELEARKKEHKIHIIGGTVLPNYRFLEDDR